jgi:hypothetical protein
MSGSNAVAIDPQPRYEKKRKKDGAKKEKNANLLDVVGIVPPPPLISTNTAKMATSLSYLLVNFSLGEAGGCLAFVSWGGGTLPTTAKKCVVFYSLLILVPYRKNQY